MSNLFSLSIIVPCHNEKEVIDQTHKRLSSTLVNITDKYEIIYINDGSTDDTLSQLQNIKSNDKHVQIIQLSRNFGHQIAVTAGLDVANGDIIVIIDADLQDPPELIPGMIERWRKGADVVYGTRISRDGETVFKKLTSKIFYRFLSSISDVDIPVDTGDFRLIDRKVADVIRNMPEKNRYLRGMLAWVGFKQESFKYERHARYAGNTSYPVWKMIKFATDGVLSFSSKPLRLATFLGFSASLLSFLAIIWAIFSRIFGNPIEGWTTLLITTLFIGGVQLICIGIIGEYIGRIYDESKSRPLYITVPENDSSEQTNKE